MTNVLRRIGRRPPDSSRQGRASSNPADWRQIVRRRATIATAVFAVWGVVIETRLVYLQVFQHAALDAQARQQQESVTSVPAIRGDIVDREGHVLATNAEAPSIAVVPSQIADASDALNRLCAALGNCTSAERQMLLKRLSNRKSPFALVRRRATEEEARRIEALKLPYVTFRHETRRFYPNNELAAHLLGWVGIDNDGLGGIEHAYNNQIRGRDGSSVVTNDGKGHVFSRVEKPPTQGAGLELTIDKALQHVAERELHAAVVENRAEGGTAPLVTVRERP